MARKRSADDLGVTTSSLRRLNTKRTKLSPLSEQNSDSSVPSSGSVSVDSALESSPPASADTHRTSFSSIQSSDADNDLESSIDESEDSGWLSDDEAEEIVNIGGPKKPQMAHSEVTDGARDLRSRLDALLPQLAASNQLLSGGGQSVSMEDVGEGERHIEMNLRLGVLEESKEHESSSGDEESDEEAGEVLEAEDAPVSSSQVKRSSKASGIGAMEKLRGQRRARQRPGIQDLGR